MRILLLIVAFLFCQPALCAVAVTKFDQYLHANGCAHVVGVSALVSTQGVKPSNLRIDFDGQQSASDVTTAYGLADSFSWLDDPPRNLSGFVMAVRTEQSFNAQIRNEMGKLLGLLAADYNTPQLAQQDWDDAVANPNNTWLTLSVQNTVISYAITYHIPLTKAIP